MYKFANCQYKQFLKQYSHEESFKLERLEGQFKTDDSLDASFDRLLPEFKRQCKHVYGTHAVKVEKYASMLHDVFKPGSSWSERSKSLQLASSRELYIKFAMASREVDNTCFMLNVLLANPGIILTNSHAAKVSTSEVTDSPLKDIYKQVTQTGSVTELFASVKQIVLLTIISRLIYLLFVLDDVEMNNSHNYDKDVFGNLLTYMAFNLVGTHLSWML